MLAKLLKYEITQTAKFFLPIFGGITVLGVLTKILLLLGNADAENKFSIATTTGSLRVFDTIAYVFLFLIFLAMIALVMGTIIITVQRFYKNLLGDEGYLMFTLPVTAAQHIWAKLLVGTLWTLASVALLFGGIFFIINAPIVTGSGEMGVFSALFQVGVAQFGTSFYGLLVVILVALVMGIMNTYLMLYTSMAIGAQWPQSRALASIIAYFGIQTVLQGLMIVGTVTTGLMATNSGVVQTLMRWTNNWMYLNPVSVVNVIFLGATALLLVGNVAYFFATNWLLSKKLNLA